jgi:hypothetical protein
MAARLKELKGVGEKVAERLVAHYGSEEEALRSLDGGEYDRLFSIEELPLSTRVEIYRAALARRENFSPLPLLRTPEAREVYETLLETLREHATTGYGRFRLASFSPTRDPRELERRRGYIRKGIALFRALGEEGVRDLKEKLGLLTPLPPTLPSLSPLLDGCLIATEDRDLYGDLSRKYGDSLPLLLIESPEDLRYLEGYAQVRYLPGEDSRFSSLAEGISHVEVIYGGEEEFLPEAVLAFFLQNRERIRAAVGAYRVLEKRGLEGRFMPDVDTGEIACIEEGVAPLGERGVEPETQGGLLHFTQAVSNFRGTLEECLREANREVAKRAEEGDLSLQGKDVLELLSGFRRSQEGAAAKVPPQILDLLREVAERWERECARRLKVEDEVLFSGLFSSDPLYPFEVWEEGAETVERWLRRRVLERELEVKRELSRALGRQRNGARLLVRRALELDPLLAVGEFSVLYGASFPTFTPTLGIAFRKGRHLLLQRGALRGGQSVEAVDYVLGESSPPFEEVQGERIAILTGANSGGKTTLLETLAQIQTMAQCGLPVLAEEASIALLDEVYFFGRKRGGAGEAGAFEALIRGFAEMAGGREGKKRLILADEIEAVTEPGAAALVLSALLSWFERDRDTLLLLVTHLGNDLEALPGVRIDGIEAEGLDTDLNLIVRRSPLFYRIARSTPQLIVERLSRTEERSDFYRHLLRWFKENGG